MVEDNTRAADPSGLAVDEAPLPLGAIVSAIVFSAPKPLSLAQLEEATGEKAEVLEAVLANLKSLYQEETHGFTLCEVANGYQFRTSRRASGAITKLHAPKTKKLSRAAAETLAVIAYKQPVQRSEIEAIRGVDVLPTLKTLLEAKLIRMIGHDDAVGQPAIYGTTNLFLERFGLRDLSELPSIRELDYLAEEPGEAESETPSAEAEQQA